MKEKKIYRFLIDSKEFIKQLKGEVFDVGMKINIWLKAKGEQ